ncbi:uncharacterized protein SPSK_10056 [Sporothrix schenckii 1099-18]|uniref:Uncharacterized protein n=1 Tax=Sporothrix schenckii 1099-18 TaxID=1397361 RepID=A0A0F2M9J7_SPOSC|nr:uncharacterized protein SPSK_10056 [Sporothrix schenckii 1099-18]KJR85470.1 hypothetical protein SPSK_10056 [Sporothrix schenckii 1099-18]
MASHPPPDPPPALPPEDLYESREALLLSINAWAASHGCAFVTGRSIKYKLNKRVVTYAYDRSGRAVDHGTDGGVHGPPVNRRPVHRVLGGLVLDELHGPPPQRLKRRCRLQWHMRSE